MQSTAESTLKKEKLPVAPIISCSASCSAKAARRIAPWLGAKASMETAASVTNMMTVESRCSGMGSLCIHHASGVGSDCDW